VWVWWPLACLCRGRSHGDFWFSRLARSGGYSVVCI